MSNTYKKNEKKIQNKNFHVELKEINWKRKKNIKRKKEKKATMGVRVAKIYLVLCKHTTKVSCFY